MRTRLEDDLAVGDIIQCEGDTVPADVQGKYFIVRALEPDISLSWPYWDAECTRLYVPQEPGQTQAEWLAHCQTIERKEKAANAALGVVLKAVQVH